jgi:hypothetical protein
MKGTPFLVNGERRDPGRSEIEARAAKRPAFNPNFTFYMTAAPGLFVGTEIEAEVEIRVVGEHYPRLEVEAVWINIWKQPSRGKFQEIGCIDLLKSNVPYLYELGCAIAEAAGEDEDWVAEQMGEQGYVLLSRDANDPDARWYRAKPEREE